MGERADPITVSVIQHRLAAIMDRHVLGLSPEAALGVQRGPWRNPGST